MMRKNLYLGLSLVILPFVYQSSAKGIALDFSATPTVEVGERVNVDIVISDLGDGSAPSLGTYDFEVNFDSSILSFDSATFGDPVLGNQLDIGGFGSINEVLEPSSSTINLSELSLDFPEDLDTSQADSFTLATLSFDAIADGTSSLEFDNLILGDALGDPLTVTVDTGSITVDTTTPIPESSTIFSLVALGLVGLGMSIYKR